MTVPHLSESAIATLVMLWRSNRPDEYIGEKIGIAAKDVHSIGLAMKIPRTQMIKKFLRGRAAAGERGRQKVRITVRPGGNERIRPWSESDDAVVRGLWANGHTAKTIGEKIGRQPKAVSRRAQKLNLQRSVIRHRQQSEMSHRAGSRLRGQMRCHLTPRGGVNGGVRGGGPMQANRAMEGMMFKTCQWIEGEPMSGCCGKPVAAFATPYCRKHAERAYRPREAA